MHTYLTKSGVEQFFSAFPKHIGFGNFLIIKESRPDQLNHLNQINNLHITINLFLDD